MKDGNLELVFKKDIYIRIFAFICIVGLLTSLYGNISFAANDEEPKMIGVSIVDSTRIRITFNREVWNKGVATDGSDIEVKRNSGGEILSIRRIESVSNGAGKLSWIITLNDSLTDDDLPTVQIKDGTDIILDSDDKTTCNTSKAIRANTKEEEEALSQINSARNTSNIESALKDYKNIFGIDISKDSDYSDLDNRDAVFKYILDKGDDEYPNVTVVKDIFNEAVAKQKAIEAINNADNEDEVQEIIEDSANRRALTLTSTNYNKLSSSNKKLVAKDVYNNGTDYSEATIEKNVSAIKSKYDSAVSKYKSNTSSSDDTDKTQTTGGDVVSSLKKAAKLDDRLKAAREVVKLISNNSMSGSEVQKQLVESTNYLMNRTTQIDGAMLQISNESKSKTFEVDAQKLSVAVNRVSNIINTLQTALDSKKICIDDIKFNRLLTILLPDSIYSLDDMKVIIPKSAISKAREVNIGITVKHKDISISMNSDEIDGVLGSDKLTNLSLIYNAMPTKNTGNKDLRGIGKTYHISLGKVIYDEKTKSNKTEEINEFNGEAIIQLAYTDADLAKVTDVSKIGAYRYDEELGKWIRMKGLVDTENKLVTFKTTETGKFEIMEYIKDFDDVSKEDWAYDYIKTLASRQITEGITENTFEPTGRVSRAQFVTLIVRALEIDTKGYKGYFKDVNKTEWYANEVEAAVNKGIVSGDGNGRFNPNAYITREEMAVIIMKAYSSRADIDIYEEAAKAAGIFEDASKMSDWSRDSVLAAKAMGLISGDSDSKFSPKAPAERAQAAKLIVELMKKIGIK